jgi:hypothetical protein
MTQKVKSADNALLNSQAPQSTGEFLSAYLRRLRGGDLGPLPIILGLIVIAFFLSIAESTLSHCAQLCQSHPANDGHYHHRLRGGVYPHPGGD